MKKYLCSVFGKNQFSEITINFLWRIREKKPEDIMSHDEIRQFKMAFVICIITKFLAPVSLNNFISPRYMKALIDVDNISQYNWAKFVVDELKLAAVSLQEKLANGKAAGYINGCIILLQILYLDNLDFGTDSLPHDRFPRISAYNDSNVADLMKRDILLPNRWPFPSFGKHKLRDPRQSCYAQQTCSPATDARNINQESPHTPSVQQVSAHTPRDIEVSTDTHIDLVSAHTSSALQVSIDTRSMIQVSADTQSPIRDSGHAKSMPGISPPSFSLGLTQMLDDSPEPHIKTNLNRDFEMVADQQAVVPETPPEKQGCSKTDFTGPVNTTLTSPHSILKEVNGVRIMMREEYAVTKYPPKSKRKIIGAPGDMLVERPKRAIKPSKSVVSPFLSKQNQLVRRDDKATQELFNLTRRINDDESLNKIWVHISKPVPMSLKLKDIQQALGYDSDMQDDTFNVAVQALFEDELEKFSRSEFLGWRHYLNQDFAMFAVAEENLWNAEDHIHLFTDSTLVPYDVSQCRLIFVPVHEPDHYVLYAFDMENKKVCVLDPLKRVSKGRANIRERYEKIKMRISNALQECLKLAFPDWSEEIKTWDLVIPPKIKSVNNKVDTSFQVVNCMRNWDGTRLVNPMPEDPEALRKEFLINLLSFKNNEAILPGPVQKIITSTNRR